MEYKDSCPIWGTPAVKQNISGERGTDKKVRYINVYAVKSPRIGGQYKITRDAHNTIGRTGVDDALKTRLTTWIVDQHRFGVEWPDVNSEIIEMVNSRRSLSVYSRANRLLKYIASETPRIGSIFHYYPRIESFPEDQAFEILALSESVDKGELAYLLKFLEKSNFLENRTKNVGRWDYVVTPLGHAHLAELEVKNVKSHQAFIAMWFDSSMENIYKKGIKPAVRQAGYESVRIDNKHHNNKIDDEIIAEIRRSRFLVADFTHGDDGARGGVYYETGFAHGLNMPVIFTCSRKALKEVHFDTRQYNHIVWEDPVDLLTQLTVRISATIGDGPLKGL